jgi:hypothetical protein
MTTPARRLRVLPVALSAVAVAGVLVSVAMVVIGLPEQNAVQSVLLELSMAPTSVSLLAVLALLSRRARPAGPRSRWALITAGVLGCAGAASMVMAYTCGPRPLVHFGQALVLVCLLAALLIELRLQPARRHAWFELRDASEE